LADLDPGLVQGIEVDLGPLEIALAAGEAVRRARLENLGDDSGQPLGLTP
jgi:hypothetical protein